MTSRNPSRFRLILNGVGCAVIALLSLALCFSLFGSLGSLSHPPATDPDRSKAIWLYLLGGAFCGAVGLAAGISLVRTVKGLRRPESD